MLAQLSGELLHTLSVCDDSSEAQKQFSGYESITPSFATQFDTPLQSSVSKDEDSIADSMLLKREIMLLYGAGFELRQ